nr:intergral membrane NMN transport protein PnuC [Salmonella sp. NCTC 7297]
MPLSWIEAIGTVFGLLCIWCASREKIINYLFGLINVTLFAAIFFQIQLYASLLLQVFFFAANIYGWYAWSRQNDAQEAALKVRWLTRQQAWVLGGVCIVAILLMTWFIDPGLRYVDPRYARASANGRYSGGDA